MRTVPLDLEIDFAIAAPGVQKITLVSPLPIITSPVVLNGLSQSIGPPEIELDGSQCSTSGPCDGLVVQGGGTTIEGVAVVDFAGRGVVFDGSQTGLGGNTLQSSYVGWDAGNAAFNGNDDTGVEIVSSPNNHIGSGGAAGRVVIGGNAAEGSQAEAPDHRYREHRATPSPATGSGSEQTARALLSPSTASSSRAARTTTRSAARTPSETRCTPSTRTRSTSGTAGIGQRRRRKLDRPRRQRCDEQAQRYRHRRREQPGHGDRRQRSPTGIRRPDVRQRNRRGDRRGRLRQRLIGWHLARRQLHRHRPAGEHRARERPGCPRDRRHRQGNDRSRQHDHGQHDRRRTDRHVLRTAHRRQLDLRQRRQGHPPRPRAPTTTSPRR